MAIKLKGNNLVLILGVLAILGGLFYSNNLFGNSNNNNINEGYSAGSVVNYRGQCDSNRSRKILIPTPKYKCLPPKN
jgi:hypothetical protein